jgi:hypothetical protein
MRTATSRPLAHPGCQLAAARLGTRCAAACYRSISHKLVAPYWLSFPSALSWNEMPQLSLRTSAIDGFKCLYILLFGARRSRLATSLVPQPMGRRGSSLNFSLGAPSRAPVYSCIGPAQAWPRNGISRTPRCLRIENESPIPASTRKCIPSLPISCRSCISAVAGRQRRKPSGLQGCGLRF